MFVSLTWVLVFNPHKIPYITEAFLCIETIKESLYGFKTREAIKDELKKLENTANVGETSTLEGDLRHLGGDRGDGEEDGEEQAEEDQGEDRLLHRGHPPRQLLDDLDAEKRPAEDSGPSQSHQDGHQY